MNKKRYTIQIVVFVALLFSPILFSIIIESGFDKDFEGRDKFPFPNLSFQNIVNIMNEVEAYLNDRYAFRDKLIALDGNIRLHVFKTSTKPLIIVGKNGFNFYTGWQNYDISRNLYTLPEDTILGIIKEQEDWQKYFDEKGIEYFLVFTPSQVSVYPEYLPDGGYMMNDKTPIDIIQERIEAVTEVNVINTKSAVVDYKKYGNVFHKTDTHWTGLGAYAGYKEIINSMVEKNIIVKDNTEVQFVEVKFKGEFSKMLGSNGILPDEKTLTTKIIGQKAVKEYNVPKVTEFDQIRIKSDLIEPIYYFRNESKKDNPVILIFGDSYFGSWNVNELFAENFYETYFVWTNNKNIGTTGINKEIINSIKPDIVIFERTERFINVLGKDFKEEGAK